jgi:hypothetical protein
MKYRCAFLSVVVLMVLLGTAYANAEKPWQANLKQSLLQTYTLSRLSGGDVRITQEGTLLVIRKPNISGDIARANTLPLFSSKNKVIDGKVQQGTGSGNVFKVGDKVYVLNLSVNDDAVNFILISADMDDITVHGTTQRTRYRSQLSFVFPKGTLETADVASVKKVIDEVIATEETVTAVKSATVELGQSPAQVEAALGKPDTIVKLGAKMTYVYKTMKVIFQDNKVADVQ